MTTKQFIKRLITDLQTMKSTIDNVSCPKGLQLGQPVTQIKNDRLDMQLTRLGLSIDETIALLVAEYGKQCLKEEE
jgi:hypothetical protein